MCTSIEVSAFRSRSTTGSVIINMLRPQMLICFWISTSSVTCSLSVLWTASSNWHCHSHSQSGPRSTENNDGCSRTVTPTWTTNVLQASEWQSATECWLNLKCLSLLSGPITAERFAAVLLCHRLVRKAIVANAWEIRVVQQVWWQGAFLFHTQCKQGPGQLERYTQQALQQKHIV